MTRITFNKYNQQRLTTIFCKNISVNISKRFMQSRSAITRIAQVGIRNHPQGFRNSTNAETILHRPNTTTNPVRNAHHQAWKMKSKSAKSAYSNDDGTGHTHGLKMTCKSDPECATKVCPKLCGPVEEASVSGHGTHKVPPGKKGVLLGNTDFDNTQKDQYWCPSSSQTVISKGDLQDLTENDMEPKPNVTAYLNSTQDIINKTT